MDHAFLDTILDLFVALVTSVVGLAVWLTKRLVTSYLERLKALEAESRSQGERIRDLERDMEYASRHGGTGP